MKFWVVLISVLALSACGKHAQGKGENEETAAQASGAESESMASAPDMSGAYGSTPGPSEQGAGATAPSTMGAAPDQTMNPEVDVEAIRSVLAREEPEEAEAIRTLIIEEEDGVVTLRGYVRDPASRPEIVAIVEQSPGVTEVRDELEVLATEPSPSR